MQFQFTVHDATNGKPVASATIKQVRNKQEAIDFFCDQFSIDRVTGRHTSYVITPISTQVFIVSPSMVVHVVRIPNPESAPVIVWQKR